MPPGQSSSCADMIMSSSSILAGSGTDCVQIFDGSLIRSRNVVYTIQRAENKTNYQLYKKGSMKFFIFIEFS